MARFMHLAAMTALAYFRRARGKQFVVCMRMCVCVCLELCLMYALNAHDDGLVLCVHPYANFRARV